MIDAPHANESELHDTIVEDWMLSTMLVNDDACHIGIKRLRSEDFYTDSRCLIFATIAKLSSAGCAIDAVTVRAALPADKRAHMSDYIFALAEMPSVAGHASDYCTTITTHSAKRRALLATVQAREAVMHANGDVSILPAKLERITADAVAEMRGRDDSESAIVARFHTAAQIAESAPPSPPAIIDDTLYAGHSHVLIAPPKVGKSTLCFDWSRAITTGETWAGRDTAAGRVVYLSEEGAGGLAYKIRKHGLEASGRFYVATPADLMGLDFAARIDLAGEMAADVGAGVVFVDTLSAVAGIRGEDENTAGVALELIAHLDRLKQAGLAVVCVQHQRKSAGVLAESGRGSSAIAGGFDFLIGLERAKGSGHDNRRTMTIEGRIDVPPTVVVDLGQDGRFHFVGDVKDAAKADAKRIILDLLRSVTRESALGEKEIVESVGEQEVGRTAVRDALRELVEDRSIIRELAVNGLRKNAYGYWPGEAES